MIGSTMSTAPSIKHKKGASEIPSVNAHLGNEDIGGPGLNSERT
jgi:hypothetical protein